MNGVGMEWVYIGVIGVVYSIGRGVGYCSNIDVMDFLFISVCCGCLGLLCR